MKNPAGESRSRRHSLSDWLALHELDPATCHRLLDAMTWDAAGEPSIHQALNSGYQAIDLEVAWLRTVEAMRYFFSDQQSFIIDTFEKTVKIVVHQNGKSRKAATLNNGPTAYPTILLSYRSEPSDSLVIAHEFAHALQIRASRGKFVSPIIREVCAFLGEGALLSYILDCNAAEFPNLMQVWQGDNYKYFGAQRNRLRAALLRPYEPYKYSWNYPVARLLAIRISERCSRDWIWSVFEGEVSVRRVLRELALFPS